MKCCFISDSVIETGTIQRVYLWLGQLCSQWSSGVRDLTHVTGHSCFALSSWPQGECSTQLRKKKRIYFATHHFPCLSDLGLSFSPLCLFVAQSKKSLLQIWAVFQEYAAHRMTTETRRCLSLAQTALDGTTFTFYSLSQGPRNKTTAMDNMKEH